MSAKDVLERVAAKDPRYAELAKTLPERATKEVVRRPLPCTGLGPIVERKGCNCGRNDVRTCLYGHGKVAQNGKCESCDDYEADD